MSTLACHRLVHPDGRELWVYGEGAAARAAPPATPGHDPAPLHRRFDRLTGTWVLVSPARNTRPGGATEACPLCPGGPELPWPYDAAVFDNRFPSLSPLAPAAGGTLVAPSRGRCQVVVYTDAHDGSMATLTPAEVARVVAVWRDRTAALWAEGHRYVMAFENRGAGVGATLAHPHGQIYALGHTPPVVRDKVAAHHEHRRREASCLGCVLVAEDEASDRVVIPNPSFVVAVPFAARWPYEVQVRARRHGARRLADLDPSEALDLARVLHDLVRRYDALFGVELPYLLCVQDAPGAEEDWHLHVELLPPHRNEHQLKVRASVETALGVFINDTLPEATAARLAAVAVAEGRWAGVTVPSIVAAAP